MTTCIYNKYHVYNKYLKNIVYVSCTYMIIRLKDLFIYKYHHFHVFVQLELAWRKKNDATNRYSKKGNHRCEDCDIDGTGR